LESQRIVVDQFKNIFTLYLPHSVIDNHNHSNLTIIKAAILAVTFKLIFCHLKELKGEKKVFKVINEIVII